MKKNRGRCADGRRWQKGFAVTSFGDGRWGLLEVVTGREIASLIVEPSGWKARWLPLH